MILASVAALMLLAFGSQSDSGDASRGAGTVSVRHQIIIRVTTGDRRSAPTASPTEWREGRGPRCVPARQIVGATRINQNSFDLLLRNSRRIRARLERRCPALDYYYGFYVNTTEDGRICADRDVIRSRAGVECAIEHFRSLTPARR